MKLPRSVTVEVTQDDIEQGTISNDACPVALAFRRATRTTGSVFVDPFNIRAEEPAYQDGPIAVSHTVQYPMPPAAQAFVEAFDEDQDIRPFTFQAVAIGADQ